MHLGKQILTIRTEQSLTQEEFGALFHVTRQTVSNWENAKSYPDLQTLVDISDRFQISLDQLLKEDPKMIKTIDKERTIGNLKKQLHWVDALMGAGTGMLLSTVPSPASPARTAVVLISAALILTSWAMKSRCDKKIIQELSET